MADLSVDPADRGFRVLDLLADPMWHAAADGRLDWVNRAWLAFTGSTLAEAIEKGWGGNVHPDDREACLAACRDGFEARRPFRLECRLRHHDGSYRWIASSGTPEFDGEGRLSGYFGCCHDIHDRKVIEGRLLLKQQFLAAILESVDYVIVACDAEGRLSFLSRKAREIEAMAGKDVPPERWAHEYRLLDPASRRLLSMEEVPLYRAWKGEPVVGQEFDRVDIQGQRRRMVCNGWALHGARGEPLGAVVLSWDVTAEREAERLQRRAQATKRAITDILTLTLDTAPLPARAQRALDAVLEGSSVAMGGDGRLSLHLAAEGGIEAAAATAAGLSEQAPCRRDFPIFIEGRAIGVLQVATFLPLDAAQGEFFETSSTLLAAMVQRARWEEKITQLSRVVEQSNNGILITDAQGTILYANPALLRSRGYGAEEVVGAKPSLFKSGRTPEAVYRELWATIRAGEDWCGELQNRRKDGSLLWERVTISPIRDQENRLINFVASCEDLTLVKQAEQQRQALESRLSQAEKMEAIGHLAGGIAHDFNNILVAILGFTELAQKEFGAVDQRLGSYLDHSLRAGLRARDLVAQLLTFSRNTPLDAQPLAPGPVVHEVVKLLRSTIPSSLSISLAVADDLPSVRIDPVQLHQVIMNLCINARDATAGHGRLDIELRRARDVPETYCASCHKGFGGEYLVIAVRDDGTGIPAAERGRIFEPFFTTKEVGKGTGMGLSVVHGIVHFHGGHVAVAISPGGGTEFAIYLPVADSAEECPPAVADSRPGRLCGHALVIDDEEAIALFVAKALEGAGCRVTVETDSLAAWDRFAGMPDAFDLVVVDQTMPNLTGKELCARMLALRPELPIMLWTGFSPEVDEISAAALGIRRFMLKPVSASALRAAAAELLAGEGGDDREPFPG